MKTNTEQTSGGAISSSAVVRRPRMEIYATAGAKVIMDYPEAGWPHDQRTIQRLGLKTGAEYTVDHTEVHSSSTTLYLREFPGERFNTVNFCDA